MAEDRGPTGGKWPQRAICSPACWSDGYRSIVSTGHSTKTPKSTCDIVKARAKTFRRPVTDKESFASLAKPHHPKDQPMHKMVQRPYEPCSVRHSFFTPANPFRWTICNDRLSFPLEDITRFRVNQPCQRKETHPAQDARRAGGPHVE